MKNIYYLFTISIVIFHSTLNAQWVQTNVPSGGMVTCLAAGLNGASTNLFAGTYDAGIFLSTNDGTSWQAVNNGLGDYTVNSIALSGSNIFAGNGGIYRSTNNGASWELVTVFPNEETSKCIAVSDSEVFAGTGQWNGGPGEIYRSADNGTSWNLVFVTRRTYIFVSSLIISDTNVFAGTGGLDNNVYRSSNNGTTWIVDDTTFYGGGSTRAFAVSGSNLFAGTNTGVYLSTNNGLSWTPVNNGLPDYVNNYGWITTLAVSPNGAGGNNLFAGTDTAGVYLSTNNGESWTAIGMSNIYINSLAVSDSNLFAGTYSGVWRRPLSEMITGVEDHNNGILSQFILEQNFPNPFNPSTKINYTIPKNGNVSLKVFNLLGSEVAELVNGEMNAGNHDIEFNAVNPDGSGQVLPSGVYLYKLQAGSFVETKKMMLLK